MGKYKDKHGITRFESIARSFGKITGSINGGSKGLLSFLPVVGPYFSNMNNSAEAGKVDGKQAIAGVVRNIAILLILAFLLSKGILTKEDFIKLLNFFGAS